MTQGPVDREDRGLRRLDRLHLRDVDAGAGAERDVVVVVLRPLEHGRPEPDERDIGLVAKRRSHAARHPSHDQRAGLRNSG
jgi:hypothetical protein